MKTIFAILVIFFSLITNAQDGPRRVQVSNEQLNKLSGRKIEIRTGIQDNDDDNDSSENNTDGTNTHTAADKHVSSNSAFEKVEAGKRHDSGKLKMLMATFYPGQGAPDLMIAAGHTYLVVSDAGSFSFYDKDGNILPLKPGGIDVNWSATNFFQPLIDSANKNNFPYLQDAPDNITTICGHGEPPERKIISEAYDVRVIYEQVNKRFIICAALRNSVWLREGNDLCTKNGIRIFAYAVSVTEDPRDGFMMWYWTKNNYRDWPQIAADKDVLIQAHAGANKKKGTPSIYVISMQDLIAGATSPRWFVYREGESGTPSSVAPVAKFKTGTTVSSFDDYEMFMDGDGDNAVLYYFKKNSLMWVLRPALKHTDIDLYDNIGFKNADRPVFRNGNIYLFDDVQTEKEKKNVHPPIHGFDLYRLPLKKDGSDLVFNTSSPKKLEYKVHTNASTNEAWMSYEMPAIAVDERGTICTAYGRLGKTNASTFVHPEARYFLFYNTETNHRPSELIHAGDLTPLSSYQPAGWSSSHTTIDGYYKPGSHFDYTTATPDPEKRFIFWVAHAYASAENNGYKMVISKIAAY